MYHKPLCSESGCDKPTRNFHAMLMRYICSKCLNKKMLTYGLISRAVVMRFFAVTKKELKSIPCSRFRDSNSQYGPVPRWYLRLHVQRLSIETWKTRASSNRKSYKYARKSGQLLSPHPSSPSYIPSYIHTNRRELKLEASTRSTSFVFKSKKYFGPHATDQLGRVWRHRIRYRA